ncbi:hypothetical protein DM02DRAFT_707753, partial [Periconia macrospinosa]
SQLPYSHPPSTTKPPHSSPPPTPARCIPSPVSLPSSEPSMSPPPYSNVRLQPPAPQTPALTKSEQLAATLYHTSTSKFSDSLADAFADALLSALDYNPESPYPPPFSANANVDAVHRHKNTHCHGVAKECAKMYNYNQNTGLAYSILALAEVPDNRMFHAYEPISCVLWHAGDFFHPRNPVTLMEPKVGLVANVMVSVRSFGISRIASAVVKWFLRGSRSRQRSIFSGTDASIAEPPPSLKLRKICKGSYTLTILPNLAI